MQEENVSQSEFAVPAESVDHGRRKALVRLGTYSALATPAVITLLTEKSAAGVPSRSKPKDPKDPKDPKRP